MARFGLGLSVWQHLPLPRFSHSIWALLFKDQQWLEAFSAASESPVIVGTGLQRFLTKPDTLKDEPIQLYLIARSQNETPLVMNQEFLDSLQHGYRVEGNQIIFPTGVVLDTELLGLGYETSNWALVSNNNYVEYVCWRKKNFWSYRANEISFSDKVSVKREGIYEVKDLSKTPVLFTIQDVEMSGVGSGVEHNRMLEVGVEHNRMLEVGLSTTEC
jgi:hypothetical protein